MNYKTRTILCLVFDVTAVMLWFVMNCDYSTWSIVCSNASGETFDDTPPGDNTSSGEPFGDTPPGDNTFSSEPFGDSPPPEDVGNTSYFSNGIWNYDLFVITHGTVVSSVLLHATNYIFVKVFPYT